MLSGGNRTSLGRTHEVVAEVLAGQRKLPQLMACLAEEDPVLRLRASDAIEKISRSSPEWLVPFKLHILGIAGAIDQIEVRWHMAQILPRLSLTARERTVAIDILLDYLQDRSSIVKTHAMQAVADFAASHPKLKTKILPLLEELVQIGTPAMRARGRKLVVHLNRPVSNV